MKAVFSLFCGLGMIGNAYAADFDGYLKENHLFEAYQQKVKTLKENKYVNDALPRLDSIIELTIGSSLNDSYKVSYLADLIKEFPYHPFKDGTTFVSLYAVRHDPLGSIRYLEGLKNRNLEQDFQLMVLWHIYQPEKVASDLYKDTAQKRHNELTEYFETGKWQSGWRKNEYNGKVGDDYQACYADLKCFLDIIPYWRKWDDDFDVYIPCETAQKYDKVVYFDSAAGGHGAQSFMASDCELYDKYSYDKNLKDYMDKLFFEGIPESGGSIRFYYQAEAVNDSLMLQYSPKFDLEPQKRWDIFPYTEWAVQSYYNFAKYNEILNYGIGYQKALEALTKHYVENFGAAREQAYNTALYALKIPSMNDWGVIAKDNLQYMLLAGRPFKEIKEVHKDIKDYKKLLEFSIAYPENLKEIIRLGKNEADFDINYANWFGKTPLMIAAQYGYLDSVKVLLENGADVNKQTLDLPCLKSDDSLCIRHGKRSALMYAAQEGQFDVLKYLLEEGANISLQDTAGLTAYDYMVGTELTHNPHIRPTIRGGAAQYWEEKDRKSAFSPKQVQELAPLLKGKK